MQSMDPVGLWRTLAVIGWLVVFFLAFKAIRTKLKIERVKPFLGAELSTQVLAGRVKTGLEARFVSYGFVETDLSEGILPDVFDPEYLVNTVSRYNNAVNDVVNGSDGHIELIRADSYSIIWNPFGKTENPGVAACSALLDLADMLRSGGQEGTEALGWSFRASVASGTAVVGLFGSRDRCQFGVGGAIAQTANAVRTIGLRLQLSIAVDQNTKESLPGDFVLRPIERVQLPLIPEPITVFELMGYKNRLSDRISVLVDGFERAFVHYELMNWAEAEKRFARLGADYPEDQVTASLAARCRQFCDSPPPEDWNGAMLIG